MKIAFSVAFATFASVRTARKGYLPTAVSFESMKASDRSKIEFAASLTSALVAIGFSTIDCKI